MDFLVTYWPCVYGGHLQIAIPYQDSPPKLFIPSSAGHPSFHILGSLEADAEGYIKQSSINKTIKVRK